MWYTADDYSRSQNIHDFWQCASTLDCGCVGDALMCSKWNCFAKFWNSLLSNWGPKYPHLLYPAVRILQTEASAYQWSLWRAFCPGRPSNATSIRLWNAFLELETIHVAFTASDIFPKVFQKWLQDYLAHLRRCQKPFSVEATKLSCFSNSITATNYSSSDSLQR